MRAISTFQDEDITKLWEDLFQSKDYRIPIQDLADNYPDKRSIDVSYPDLDIRNTDIAMYILENPDKCLALGKAVILSLMPPEWDPKNHVNLRIIKLPHDAKVGIRKLRETHLGRLVAIDGLAKKVSSVKPRMTYARFLCSRCGAEVWEPQSGMYLREPLMCPNPNGTCNKQANRFIIDNKKCHFIDTQKIELQESPEGLKGGQQPEKISGYAEDDLCGVLTAGNRITVNGIVRPVEKSERDKSTIFEIYLEILSVEFEQEEYEEIVITEEDERAILQASKEEDLFDNIVASIAPTIHGNKEVKQAIALQLFGGSRKVLDDGSVLRGDTHILLVGDPGVAKSQILRYMSTLAPRAIFASGKSASSAGLTAAAVKDDFGGDGFVLEAGALVLADKGLACIDELDKMTEQDTSSLHEAMESQRISIAKAGITTVLQCRCSLLAAANPKEGRFNREKNLAEQIDLPPALKSRFDLIFVLTDVPNETKDRKLALHMLNVQQRGQALHYAGEDVVNGIDLKAIRDNSENVKPHYSAEFLRKYVAYSKRIVPILTDSVKKSILDSYMAIRNKGGENHAISITPRQLEAFIRLSEAAAKMRLSPVIEKRDADIAIHLIEYYLETITGGTGDIDMVVSSVSQSKRMMRQVLRGIIGTAGNSGISVDDILVHPDLSMYNSEDMRKAIKDMETAGEIYSPQTGIYCVV